MKEQYALSFCHNQKNIISRFLYKVKIKKQSKKGPC